MSTTRFGEASHPGPHGDDWLTVGVSNPGGVRQKEQTILELGPGIWSFTETQLSAQTFRTSSHLLRTGARSQQREIHLHGGAPAPLRQGSSWAGGWTGVAVISDVPSQRLEAPWPLEHWNSGRVLMTRRWICGLAISMGTCYGYAQGPTWPKARQLTDQLLQTFTTEMVLGMEGIRIIAGDFNQEPLQLDQQCLWHRLGWRNAQEVAADLLNHLPVPTCKGVNERDQLWLSPEAIQLLRGIQVTDHFADHSTVQIQLQIPSVIKMVQRWPRPAEIPWTEGTWTQWQPECQHDFKAGDDPTDFLRHWSHGYEAAIFAEAASQKLQFPGRCRGRAQRLKPETQPQTAPVCKPSREGEVKLCNSMVGMAVRLWFKQLRRIQSLQHALAANKQTPAARAYRLELWLSIRHSSGFSPNFPDWWHNQQHGVDGVPQRLPATVPNELVIVKAIYESFLSHFRRFEQWHLNERSKSLRMRYEGSLEALYGDLRHDPKPGVTNLWKDEVYTILALDPEHNRIQLDRDVQNNFDSFWLHDDHFVVVKPGDAGICTVSNLDAMSTGDAITQRITQTDTNEILTAFNEHWKPRWNNMAQISEEQWQRIVGFAQQYLPQHSFECAPLTLPVWRAMIKKFKKRAARGPDGFSHHDLQNMPDSYATSLLHLLDSIETDDTPWPDQLALGLVQGLGKNEDPHEVQHFRPITLFSTIYRAWARLRTKELIRQIARYMPDSALGFLPRRETTEVWLQLQALIEIMLQQDADYAGMSTDLKRAFNNIGRKQVFMIADKVGIPSSLKTAWKKFLRQVSRRFEVRNCLGEALQSTSGFPEGCPLSILAMLLVNWCYHIYMQAFCPRVLAYSFVDNLTLAAREADLVIQAYFALRSICQLFGLETDDDKTYTWALTPPSRKIMRVFGFPCLSDASELGGAMTFGLSRRTRVLRHRGSQLKPRWLKLKRSQAPGPQKIAVLSKVFWPQALHGSSNHPISDNYVAELRKEATKALCLNGAGSNPMLRLSLMVDMKADPGFYQLDLCVRTFRRLLRKCDDLTLMWRSWWAGFSGSLIPGPFSRLLQCLQTIGWSLQEPPMVIDHEGFRWDLQTMDGKALSAQLADAWLQLVAAQTKHKTMAGLRGLDGYLTGLDANSMTALDRARLSALQSGAFISAYEHSQFDPSKRAMCDQCGCPDDRAHWLRCPKYRHLRDAIPGWLHDNVELPPCVLHHLLIPRQHSMYRWKQMLCLQPEPEHLFLVDPPMQGFSHIFLDGSCLQDGHPGLSLASWAVVDATLGQLVAAHPLRGLTQSIDRAELTSLLMALRWVEGKEVHLALWSDSKSTIGIAEYVQKFDEVPLDAENQDLWQQVRVLLQDRSHLTTWLRWIPSRLEPSEAEDTFEDWLIRWNDIVDRAARHANVNRPTEMTAHHAAVKQQYENWTCRIRQLRQFFFDVAAMTQQPTSSESVVQTISDSEDEWFWTAWEDALPIGWMAQCSVDLDRIPGAFSVALVNWILAAEKFPGRVRQISDLELVFALSLDSEFAFPIPQDSSALFQMRKLHSLFQRPTVTMLLRPVQKVLQWLHQTFPFVVIRTPPQINAGFGIHMKFAGTRLYLPDLLWSSMVSKITNFTAKRAVKKVNDLARPLP
eukprot:Skav226644  [mRNA]  locus=scaffold1097:92180:97042:+ [translate_table: standard]